MTRVMQFSVMGLLVWLTAIPRITAQEQQVLVNLTNPRVPGILIFENPKGSVRVTGYDGEVVVINARFRYPADEQEEKNAIHSAGKKRPVFTAEENNNKVTLFCTNGNKTVDFDLKLPHRFSLKVGSDDNGSIEIFNVEGNIEVKNPNGDILLSNISGSAVLNSVNGKISASFNKVAAGLPMMFTSLDGDIEVYLPDHVDANLKMKTQNGKIFSDFKLQPVQGGKADGKTGIQGKGLNHFTTGKLNLGGPEYYINTYNGNIYLKKNQKPL